MRTLLHCAGICFLLNACDQPPLPPCEYSFPDCCVSFSNETGLGIETILIRTSDGDSVRYGAMGPGTQAHMLLPAAGEAEYAIWAWTENGNILSGKCGYYEGGYCIHNRILTDTILEEIR